jgi:hypothetical protein
LQSPTPTWFTSVVLPSHPSTRITGATTGALCLLSVVLDPNLQLLLMSTTIHPLLSSVSNFCLQTPQLPNLPQTCLCPSSIAGLTQLRLAFTLSLDRAVTVLWCWREDVGIWEPQTRVLSRYSLAEGTLGSAAVRRTTGGTWSLVWSYSTRRVLNTKPRLGSGDR